VRPRDFRAGKIKHEGRSRSERGVQNAVSTRGGGHVCLGAVFGQPRGGVNKKLKAGVPFVRALGCGRRGRFWKTGASRCGPCFRNSPRSRPCGLFWKNEASGSRPYFRNSPHPGPCGRFWKNGPLLPTGYFRNSPRLSSCGLYWKTGASRCGPCFRNGPRGHRRNCVPASGVYAFARASWRQEGRCLMGLSMLAPLAHVPPASGDSRSERSERGAA
jgi:hypothetical protein